MARFDLHDRAGGGEDVLRRDRRRRTVVGGDAGVLERLRELEEALLVADAEGELGLLTGLAPSYLIAC